MNTTIENMLKMSGVQAILLQLIEKAAPDLAKQAVDIGNTIVAFKSQLDRVEAKLDRLERLFDLNVFMLTEGEHDGPGTAISGNDAPADGVGKPATGD
jgi:hypothetical protein